MDKTIDAQTNSSEHSAGPSSEEPKSMENVNLALQHLATGKRDLLIADPSAAVTSLALACELLGKHYGETAFECGEAYYYYGKALLDLARQEGQVIDNIGDSESKNDEEGDEQENAPDSTENLEVENRKSENETQAAKDEVVNSESKNDEEGDEQENAPD